MPSTVIYGGSVFGATAGSGSWESTGNAVGSTSGTYAVWTASASTSSQLSLRITELDSLVPADATVDSLTFRVKHYVSNTTDISAASILVRNDSGAIGNNPSVARSTTTSNITTVTNAITGVTRAHLASSNFRAVLAYAHANNSNSATANVDWVEITCNWTPATQTRTGVGGLASTTAFGPVSVGGASTVDPNNLWKGPQQVNNFLADNPELAPIAAQPAARWINNQSDADNIPNLVTAAAGKTLLLSVYAIPGRDNGQYSAGGFPDRASYLSFIQSIKTHLGSAPAIISYEADALGLTNGMNASTKAERIETLRQAVNILGTIPNTETYIDASQWISTSEMGDMLASVDVVKIHGFSLNTSGYEAQADAYAYGAAVLTALGNKGITGKKYIVDSSRNGNGALKAGDANAKPWIDAGLAWCNPPGRAIGPVPGTVSEPNVRATLWIKAPGESDGTFPTTAQSSYYGENAPAAGAFWLANARSLLGLSPQKAGSVGNSFADNAKADFTSGFGAVIDNGELTLVDGRARLPVTTAYPYAGTASTYTVVGNSLSVEFIPGPAVTGSTEHTLQFLIESTAAPVSTRVRFQVERVAGTIEFGDDVDYYDTAAVRVTYDATAMRWLRYREADGTLYWETSPDGKAWTTRRSKARPTWMTATGNQKATFTTHAGSGASTSYVELDNLNVAPSGSTTPAVTRTNLARNPSFEVNLTDGWEQFGVATGTHTRDTAQYSVGAAALRLSNGSAGDCGQVLSLGTLPAGTYTFSAWVRTDAVQNMAVVARRPAPDYSAFSDGEIHVTGTTGWTRRSFTLTFASSQPVDLVLGLGSYGTQSSGQAWVDGVLVEQASSVGSYFDGSYSAAGQKTAWSGTPHNSTSSETTNADQAVAAPTMASAVAFGTLTARASRTVAMTSLDPASVAVAPTVTATRTVTMTSLASTTTFGAGTATAGPRSVAMTSLASTTTFGPVAAGTAATVQMASLAPTSSAGTPTGTPGSVTATPSSLSSTAVYGPAAASPGSVAALPLSVASASATGPVTASTGPVSAGPTSLPSGAALGAPSVTAGAVGVAPPSLASSALYGTLATSASVAVPAVPLASSAVATSPSASARAAVAPSSVASTAAFGAPTVSTSVTASAGGLPSTSAFGAVTTDIAVRVMVDSAASTAQFGSPSATPGLVSIPAVPLAPGTAFGAINASTRTAATPSAVGSTAVANAPAGSPGSLSVPVPARASTASAAVPGAILADNQATTPTPALGAGGFGAITTSTGPVSRTMTSLAPTSVALSPSASARISATPTALPSATAFGAPGVTTVVAVSPTSAPPSAVVGQPLGNPGPVSALPLSVAPLSVASVPEGRPGIVSATPTALASTVAVGAVQGRAGVVARAIGSQASTVAFGAPVATGTITVPVGSRASTSVSSVPSVTAEAAVAPTSLASTAAVGQPLTSTSVTASPPSVPAGSTAGGISATASVRALPATRLTSVEFGTAQATTRSTVRPVSVGSGAAFGIVQMAPGPVVCTAPGLASTAAIGPVKGVAGSRRAALESVLSATGFGRLSYRRAGDVDVWVGSLSLRWDVGDLSLGASSGLR